jgi:hypothetical protein
MIDAGYLAKAITQDPVGLELHGIREVCSVSHCISPTATKWFATWRHNDFGWFNSVDEAWAVVAEADRPRYRLFAYRIELTRFRRGGQFTSDPDTSSFAFRLVSIGPKLIRA